MDRYISQSELAAALNEWLRQYNENPEDFDTLENAGKDYGESGAAMIFSIVDERQPSTN